MEKTSLLPLDALGERAQGTPGRPQEQRFRASGKPGSGRQGCRAKRFLPNPVGRTGKAVQGMAQAAKHSGPAGRTRSCLDFPPFPAILTTAGFPGRSRAPSGGQPVLMCCPCLS